MPTKRELANVIRVLAMDAVQAANSGHPGAPMGMADIAEVLWRDFMKYNPANPHWWDRDRFVLSNGHASMLLYAVLNLTGYPLRMDELRNFRQLGSRTAGHPEHDVAIGIETTTGPLGQGFTNAVGMALAEKMLAAQFNRPGLAVVDHHTWCFVGDGCLMEGVSHEAASLAGTYQLGKLIVVYDDNGISIDGKVSGWFRDDTARRFESYGWQVLEADGQDAESVAKALKAAQAETLKPTLVCAHTVIGFGAPNKAGSSKVHGEPLGAAEVAAARQAMGWTLPPFEVPEALRAAWNHEAAGRAAEGQWQDLFRRYQAAFPDLARDYERRMSGALPADWPQTAAAILAAAQGKTAPEATRVSSQGVLNILGPKVMDICGGSADLTPSNNTRWTDAREITPDDASGRYVHYGVREFGMSGVMNGLALHGAIIPYGGTFLTFSDYARNAVRMAALMHQRVIFVYTHDSIGLGEDGPTHQPVEHVNSLRLIPNMTVWRPADATETAVAWISAVEHDKGPSCVIFTRQALPQVAAAPALADSIRRGGYVLLDCSGTPQCIVIATGSEVGIAMDAVKAAQAAGVRVRLVSMPSTSVFDAQDSAWKDAVLPPGVRARVAVEAGSTGLWWRYVGTHGRVIGMDCFGASGKAPELFVKFGITVDHISQAIKETIVEVAS